MEGKSGYLLFTRTAVVYGLILINPGKLIQCLACSVSEPTGVANLCIGVPTWENKSEKVRLSIRQKKKALRTTKLCTNSIAS